VRPCTVLADVGTDHALLPVAAVRHGLAERAIAADLREAPLRGARAHITRSGVADRVLAVRGDGLLAVQQLGVQAVVMAGMSGGSMLRMFEAAPHVLARLEQLIVQPNQNAESIRAWALRSGWHLRDERMLEERGQFFVVCAFVRAEGKDPAYALPGWSDAALCRLGPWLLTRKDAVAQRWFEQQRARISYLVQRGIIRWSAELELWESACGATEPQSRVTQTPTSKVEPGGPVKEPATGGTDSGSRASATAM
jgi:tRNA (adenine22-N1)-methyltransferase